uniref:Ig-like domain-containing protein n=1 Tax=Sarcophilus harrisii TaxID=9305 RepID=A0A7N4UYH2_SARHA
MSPALSALLCLGLCLGHRMRAQAGESFPLPPQSRQLPREGRGGSGLAWQGLKGRPSSGSREQGSPGTDTSHSLPDKPPRPSLRAENGSLGPLGRSVTLRCRGSPGAAEYFLEKYQGSRYERIDSKLSREDEVEFPISSMSLSDTGTYSCHYRTEYYWSEHSEPLELVATGVYRSPSLSVWPNSTVAPGQAVTLQCHSQLSHDRSALYKDGEQVTKVQAQLLAQGSQANFLIPAVDSTHGGTYRCYSFQRLSPHEWSFPSNPLELRVTGERSQPSPSLPALLSSLPVPGAPRDQEGRRRLRGRRKGLGNGSCSEKAPDPGPLLAGPSRPFPIGCQSSYPHTDNIFWSQERGLRRPGLSRWGRVISTSPSPFSLFVPGTSKDPPLPPSPGGTQALTPSPPSEEQASSAQGGSLCSSAAPAA